MKVIPKLQQGNTIESDNTKVVRPEIHEPIKAKPRQYSIVDLGGEPSNDTRSAAERNRDYWHPIKGAKARFKSSMSNETNPLVGIERTILPSAAGAALVTTPAAVVGGALGNMTVDKLTGGWGEWLEDKTGLPSEIGVYTNPGAWYGGIKGHKVGKLSKKFVFGDEDLGWNPLINSKYFKRYSKIPIEEGGYYRVTSNNEIAAINKSGKLQVPDRSYYDTQTARLIADRLKITPEEVLTLDSKNPKLLDEMFNAAPKPKGTLGLRPRRKSNHGDVAFQKEGLFYDSNNPKSPYYGSPTIKGSQSKSKFQEGHHGKYTDNFNENINITEAQQGMRFVSYNPVSNPTIDYTDITNPINPFSEYNYNTTYDKPTALVVPVRDTDETDVVANNTTVEPVINKSVASKSVTDKPVTANSTWKSPYTNRKQWSTELINAYKKAGITNDNAIRMLLAQDALESSWGKSAQGKYNFGNLTTGAKWKGNYVTGNDKNAKGEAIKQKFRSYNSMDEYAADKIQFLKRLYDFDENDDINKFVAKLTGSNKGKRRYAEATNYAKVLTGVYNGIPKGENGMIIKYKNPAQPIKYMGGYDKRGNIVLPVNNENGMNNVTLPEVTVTPRNINLAGAVDRGRREAAPYVSTLLTGAIFGPLSVAGGYAGNEAVNKITNVASNGKYNDWSDMMSKTTGMNPVVADFFNIGNLAGGFGMRNFGPKLKPVKDMAVGGNKWARARVISKAIDKGTPSVEPLPNNVGWGPRQSIHVVHDKNSARLPKLYFPERWDAIHEGAPEVGIWYQGKFGNPRTAANHSIPGKAEKAAKARERFAKRPYRVEGDLELERPIVTVGDVPNRAALERAADKMSADGVIFNNVYDNGYSNNQVIFSLRDNLKNSTMTHKPTGKIVTPTENNPYPKIGTATIVNGKLEPTGDIFGELLPTQGTKQVVFYHKTDPTKVVKVSKVPEEGYKTVDELRRAIKMSRARDEVPSAVPTELQGYLQGEKGMYPVFTQTKVGPIEKENVLDELAKIFESKGWTRINDSSYKNSRITVGDITTENVGMLNGKPVIFDPEAAYNEDIIRMSNTKFKNK